MRRLLATSLALGAVATVLAAPALAVTRHVSVRDDFFATRSLSITKNTTVRWLWRDTGRHNVVTASGPASFRSRIQRSGGYNHKFTRTGTYQLLCTVHSDMSMVVRVR